MRTLILLVYLIQGRPAAEVAWVPSMEKCQQAVVEISEIMKSEHIKPIRLECIQEAI